MAHNSSRISPLQKTQWEFMMKEIGLLTTQIHEYKRLTHQLINIALATAAATLAFAANGGFNENTWRAILIISPFVFGMLFSYRTQITTQTTVMARQRDRLCNILNKELQRQVFAEQEMSHARSGSLGMTTFAGLVFLMIITLIIVGGLNVWNLHASGGKFWWICGWVTSTLSTLYIICISGIDTRNIVAKVNKTLDIFYGEDTKLELTRNKIRRSIDFIKDELERNFACAQAGKQEDRRHNIKQMSNIFQRLGELTLLQFATAYPKAAQRIIGMKSTNALYSFVGGGSENTVISSGTQVIKINRRSIRWSENKRQNESQKLRIYYNQLKKHLGDMAVEQSFSVENHPLIPTQRAVMTLQSYFVFEEINIFHPYEPRIDKNELKKLTAKYPKLIPSLMSLAKNGLQFYKDTNMLVDVSGLHNVVLIKKKKADPTLKCLDSTPIFSNKPTDINRIITQLTQLQTHLNSNKRLVTVNY